MLVEDTNGKGYNLYYFLLKFSIPSLLIYRESLAWCQDEYTTFPTYHPRAFETEIVVMKEVICDYAKDEIKHVDFFCTNGFHPIICFLFPYNRRLWELFVRNERNCGQTINGR